MDEGKHVTKLDLNERNKLLEVENQLMAYRATGSGMNESELILEALPPSTGQKVSYSN